jgi:hypothetical protein
VVFYARGCRSIPAGDVTRVIDKASEVKNLRGTVYFLLLALAVASAVCALSLAGRGSEFTEYGIFLLVAAVLFVASRFVGRQPH